MAQIDGDQLRLLNKLFGLTQNAVSGVSDLDDANLTLTVPVLPELVRRGTTEANLTGWYRGVLENVHSVGDAETSSIDPYIPGDDATAPYPALVPLDWDVWLLAIAGARTSGSGDLTSAHCLIQPLQTQTGWGRDDTGGSITDNLSITVARFDSLDEANTGVTNDPFITEEGNTVVRVGMRIPRGTQISFVSTSAAAAEYQMLFIMGLFPAGLGQDILV